ncbi:hypothetical protein HOS07_gp14 [Cronobacter phage ESSI-2]|uniref:Uncharacterized protein n=1 Tax=Cronobacter phage ESSI-2 TaxID=947842 RepID=F1BUL0_9CAUD|nr:hypothetical protein HOS07_gp14 [Cronobacter phage ESSI-2]ADX32401.1 hypothetical protein [Cronobacter phage ESSI-2]
MLKLVPTPRAPSIRSLMAPISTPNVWRMYAIFPASCSANCTLPRRSASLRKLANICPINSAVSADVAFRANASVLATFVTCGRSVLVSPSIAPLISAVELTNSTALAP